MFYNTDTTTENLTGGFEGRIPEPVLRAARALREAGYEAYLVGGCVRDLLCGREPNDFDLTTSAFPDETESVFRDYPVLETGMKHGTVTVLTNGMPLEITTFRTDGNYSDGRHPDSVSFTRSLTDDLSRRDFTVNAMAWSPEGGLVDPFGGREDLKNGILRCVGNPEDRFREDALRILRLCRFSSVLRMRPEPADTETALRLRERLKMVSMERIYAECVKLLCGPDVERVLLDFYPVLEVFLPEISPCVAFPQLSPYHCYDVFTHTAKVVSGIRPDPVLRWAALLHDIAKPVCFRMQDGHASFRGHPEKGAEMASAILTRLRAPRKTILSVCRLIRDHDRTVPESGSALLRLMAAHPGREALELTELMEADCKAKSVLGQETIPAIRNLRERILNALEQKICLSVSDLKISGEDLKAAGFYPGKQMGDCLRALLADVQDERVPNEREPLLRCAEEWLRETGGNPDR